MIQWYDKFFTTPLVAKRLNRYKERMEKGKLSISLYCVALAAHPDDLLEVMNCNEFFFKHYQNQRIVVVGLAHTYDGAMELLEKILLEVYEKSGGFNMKAYFDKPE